MSKLTDKQQRFVDEYLIDLNATQAAIRAGYSEDTAKQIGFENLTKPYIKIAIEKAIDDQIKRTQITSDRVLVELAKLAFYNSQDFINEETDGLKGIHALERDSAAAITEITSRVVRNASDDDDDTVIETKIKLADKGQNLERLGKHLKLFTDKIDHGGQSDNPLNVTINLVPRGKES